MEITIMWFVWLLFVIGGFYFAYMVISGKRQVGQDNYKWAVGFSILAIIVGIAQTGIASWATGKNLGPFTAGLTAGDIAEEETPLAPLETAKTPETAKPLTAVTSDCFGVEDTSMTLTGLDFYDTSVKAGGNHKIKKSANSVFGAFIGVANDGSTTVKPSKTDTDKVAILLGDANVSFFSRLIEGKVPCSDPITLVDLINGDKENNNKLYRNGTVTVRLFNEEGNLIDTAGENETIGAGDIVTLNGDIQGQFERATMPYGGCVLAEYNSSAMDDVKVTIDGVSSRISNPTFFSVSSTSNTGKTYEVTKPIISNRQVPLGVVLDADDTINPGDTNDVTLRFYPNVYAENTATGKVELFNCGEDQDGNQLTKRHVFDSFTVSLD